MNSFINLHGAGSDLKSQAVRVKTLSFFYQDFLSLLSEEDKKFEIRLFYFTFRNNMFVIL